MNAHITGLVSAVCIMVPASGQSMDWCTYLGGSGEDQVAPNVGNAVLLDAEGRTYVVGRTYSIDFPTTDGAFDRQIDGERDAFAARLSGDGATLEWSTFLGGSGIEAAIGVTFDGQGRIVVVGGARSADFPVTGGAFDTTHNGEADAFVAILAPDAQSENQLVHCTFLGGSGVDAAYGAFYDTSGDGAIVVVGQTESVDFPVSVGAYDTSHNGDDDMFVARFDPTLGTLLASTFLGGSESDLTRHVHVRDSGLVTISGPTLSPDMPTSPGAFDDAFDAGPGERDVYVAQLDRDLTALTYGTYLGGSADEAANAMAVDGSGEILLAGFTSSTGFPVTAGAYDQGYNGGDSDVFVARLDPTAIGDAQLVASTFIGGSELDGANGVVVDRVSGAVTIAGSTLSSDYPVTPGANQATYLGAGDGLLSRLDSGLGELIYSSYLGGTETDWGFALAGDVASRLTVAGRTDSIDFPVTDGAYDESWNGGEDAFVLRVDLCASDVDESGVVGFDDILAVLSNWGSCTGGCPADVDGNGDVGFTDLLEVLANWGACA